MVKRTVFVLGLVMMTAVLTYAAGSQNQAGCGLGGLVFQQNEGAFSQISAATTNKTFWNQEFGITFGTLGCTGGGLFSSKANRERAMFASVNLRTLSRDLAVGQGEYATSFAALMGCKKESVPLFLTFTKARYDQLFPNQSTSGVEMLQNLETLMMAEPAVLQSCTL